MHEIYFFVTHCFIRLFKDQMERSLEMSETDTGFSGQERTSGPSRFWRRDGLTLGLMYPVEAFGSQPAMHDQEELTSIAEETGFSAMWIRDVPLRDPSFGDVGQIYDPWVYAAWIASRTREIVLITGAAILPLRHPLHVAKAAASLDQLSDGRFVLGVASGDRPSEFPAFGQDWYARAESFRQAFAYVRFALEDGEGELVSPLFGSFRLPLGTLPKPSRSLEMIVVGGSQQSLDWIAEHADGWTTYPRAVSRQADVIEAWRERTASAFRPIAQSLYLDLDADPGAAPSDIHLGFRAGRKFLLDHLATLQALGMNHVALNLKYGRRGVREVIEELAEHIVPHFPRSRRAEAPVTSLVRR